MPLRRGQCVAEGCTDHVYGPYRDLDNDGNPHPDRGYCWDHAFRRWIARCDAKRRAEKEAT